MIAAILAFAGIAAIANLTPGLDMMLVLRTPVSGGRQAGLAAALGINTGCLASFRRRMEQVSGVVFLGFAASLAFERS